MYNEIGEYIHKNFSYGHIIKKNVKNDMQLKYNDLTWSVINKKKTIIKQTKYACIMSMSLSCRFKDGTFQKYVEN